MNAYLIISVIVGAIVLVAGLYIAAKLQGEAEAREMEEKNEAEAAKRMAEQAAQSPRSPSELADRLRRGGGL